jgi:hypothetical protein
MAVSKRLAERSNQIMSERHRLSSDEGLDGGSTETRTPAQGWARSPFFTPTGRSRTETPRACFRPSVDLLNLRG